MRLIVGFLVLAAGVEAMVGKLVVVACDKPGSASKLAAIVVQGGFRRDRVGLLQDWAESPDVKEK